MRTLLVCCLALVCTVVPSFAEDEKIPYEFNYGLDKPPYRWSPQTFPNPMIDVTKCGREGRRSYICDPNRVIDYQEENQLDRLIMEIANTSRCPCGPLVCGRHSPGYKISIALVPRMKRAENASKEHWPVLTDAQTFATTLESRRWNFGDCDEDVVIFYSLDDNVLFTITGSEARKKLTNELVNEITQEVKHFFSRGMDITRGLRLLIIHFGDVFKGTYGRRSTLAPDIGRYSSASNLQCSIFTAFLVALLGKMMSSK